MSLPAEGTSCGHNKVYFALFLSMYFEFANNLSKHTIDCDMIFDDILKSISLHKKNYNFFMLANHNFYFLLLVCVSV